MTNGIIVVKSNGKFKNFDLCKDRLLKHVVLFNQLAYVTSNIISNDARCVYGKVHPRAGHEGSEGDDDREMGHTQLVTLFPDNGSRSGCQNFVVFNQNETTELIIMDCTITVA